MGVMDSILAIVGNILWPLFSIIGALIDVFQAIFYAFAGIGSFKIGGQTIGSANTGKATDSGIVYYFLQTDLVKNVFMSVLLLAIFLIVIFTAIAFIRNIYASKQKTWQDILSNTIKGIANFVFVPVVAMLGAWAGNILLQAINSATAVNTTQTTLSRQLFICSAYNANRARNGVGLSEASHICGLYDKFGDHIKLDFTFDPSALKEDGEVVQDKISTYTDEQYAQVVEAIFSSPDGPDPYWMSQAEGMGGYEVTTFYDTWKVNYVMLAGGGVFILYAMGAISFSMVKRLFTLVLLFVISPAVCAMYPIDEGSATNNWKTDFKNNFISVYGAVAGMNLFLALVPFINQMDFGTMRSSSAVISATNLAVNPGTMLASSAGLQWTGIVSILINIAALYMVKDFISSLSKYFGGGTDSYSMGTSLMNNSLNRVKKGLGHTVSGATKVAKAGVGAFTERSRRKKEQRRIVRDKLPQQFKDRLDELSKMSTKERKKAGVQDEYEAFKKIANNTKSLSDKEKEGLSLTGGFFRGLGRGVADIGIDVGNWLTEKAGMGKASDVVKNLTDKHKTAASDADKRITTKRDGEFGEKKFVREADDLKKITDPLKQFSDLMRLFNRAEYGEKTFDVIKKDPALQSLIKDLIGDKKADVKKLSFADFNEMAQYQGKDAALAREIKHIDDGRYTAEKIAEEVDKILGSTPAYNRDMAIDIVKNGYNDEKTADLAESAVDSVPDYDGKIFDAIIDLANNRQTDNRVRDEQIQNLQAQRVTLAQNTMEHTTNSDFASQLSQAISAMQKDLQAFKISGDFHELDNHLTEQLKKLLEAQKQSAEKFAKAMKNNQEAIVAELKKQKKDKE